MYHQVELHGLEYDGGYVPRGNNGKVISLGIAIPAIIITIIVSVSVYIWKKKNFGKFPRNNGHAPAVLYHKKSHDMKGNYTKQKLGLLYGQG